MRETASHSRLTSRDARLFAGAVDHTVQHLRETGLIGDEIERPQDSATVRDDSIGTTNFSGEADDESRLLNYELTITFASGAVGFGDLR